MRLRISTSQISGNLFYNMLLNEIVFNPVVRQLGIAYK